MRTRPTGDQDPDLFRAVGERDARVGVIGGELPRAAVAHHSVQRLGREVGDLHPRGLVQELADVVLAEPAVGQNLRMLGAEDDQRSAAELDVLVTHRRRRGGEGTQDSGGAAAGQVENVLRPGDE